MINFILTAVFVFTLFISNKAEASDEAFEDRVARIYQKFDQTEISNDEWSKIAGSKNAETYTLQQGDTLWDISEKFFGTGFYWPKVWQLNDKITNPHMIEVGNSLKFSPGTDVSPPSLDVDQNVQQTLSENTNESLDTEDVLIPAEDKPEEVHIGKLTIPKGRRSMPTLRQIPESIPEWRTFGEGFDESGLAGDLASRYNKVTQAKSFVSSIASDTKWSSEGKVTEMEGDSTVASTYQKVVVKLQSPAAIGEVYTVFSNDKEIEDPINGDDVGSEVDLKGLITIHEAVQGENDTYTAYVTRTVLPININDEIVKGNVLVTSDYDLNGSPSNVSARIVDGERTSRKNFSLHEAIYLDKGQRDGLQVGSTLEILKNYSIRNPKSVIKFDSQVIGKLKVVHVSEKVATAVLIQLKDMVLPGDETSSLGGGGGGNIESRPPVESPEPELNTEEF